MNETRKVLKFGNLREIHGTFHWLPWILRNGKHKPYIISCVACDKEAQVILECDIHQLRPWEIEDFALCGKCLNDVKKEHPRLWEDDKIGCLCCIEDE